jgi:O-antigen/teichoic acid export membrane protein
MKLGPMLRPVRQFGGIVSVLFTGAAASAGLSFLAQFLLTRQLPVTDFGRLAALLAVINFLTPVGSAGVNYFLLRAYGREGHAAARWVRPCMILVAAGTALACILLLAYASRWIAVDTPGRTLMIVACTPILLGQIAIDLASVRFQLEGRFTILSIWQCVTQAGRFAAAVWAIAVSAPLTMVMLAYALVGLVSLGLGGASMMGLWQGNHRLEGHPDRGTEPQVATARPTWLQAAPNVMPFALMTMFYVCYFQGPVAVLEWISGGAAAGVYNSAFLIIAAISLIPTVIYMRLLMPRLCRWAEHERAIFTSAFHVGVPAMALIGLVCMVCVLAAAPRLLPLLFGPAYAAGAPALMILALSIPIRFVQTAFSSVFVSERDMLRKSGYLAASAFVGLAASIGLVPYAGPIGAAIATVLAETVLLILHMIGVARFIPGINAIDTFRITTFRSSLGHLVRVHTNA